MKRGEIYYITSNMWQEIGSEQRAGRPAVIVSNNNNNNNNSEVVEIVYMTTKPKTDLPTHVLTRSTPQTSTILCEQINSVSTQRVGEYIGKLSENEMQQLDVALAISLGLDLGAVQIMREPTEEELEKIRENLRNELRVTIEPTKAAPDAQEIMPKPTDELIKVQTERDIYHELYRELLEHVKGVTA